MNSKVFQWTLHRELWRWLSENPKRYAYQWVGWKSNGGTIDKFDGCDFACKYASSCDKCPLYVIPCINDDSLETQWMNAESNEERTRLALAIMDLPVRDGVVWE